MILNYLRNRLSERNENGDALIPAILFVLISTLIVAGLFAPLMSQSKLTESDNHYRISQLNMNSGLDATKALLKYDPCSGTEGGETYQDEQLGIFYEEEFEFQREDVDWNDFDVSEAGDIDCQNANQVLVTVRGFFNENGDYVSSETYLYDYEYGKGVSGGTLIARSYDPSVVIPDDQSTDGSVG